MAIKSINGFGLIPKPSEAQVVNRAMRDKHCYAAGKDCAEAELPRDLGVEYDDERDRQCFNMGYTAGEYNDD